MLLLEVCSDQSANSLFLDTTLPEIDIAIQQALRGADEIYAAVAVQYECDLISLDNEHLTRLFGVVETRTPAD